MAIATLVVVLVVCAGGLTAVAMQVRCIDAAREAARLAARGDETGAGAAARGVGPAGATLQLRRDGEFVVATVSGYSRLLPGVTIRADAIAAAEPGR
ncbi:TadE family type IV pilus minor pilin [Mycolicibacterium sarraceniae]|uniref:TadE family type IV pilus minor pilin n=1 Tax=Mycolicibacterium sarraceniae TaxID=1534348 RepID=UPI0015D2FA14|nr:TadE family type IV pilus minor pilin [Mycolicibacterium sarraceniae]